jgi:hypothetical protein
MNEFEKELEHRMRQVAEIAILLFLTGMFALYVRIIWDMLSK